MDRSSSDVDHSKMKCLVKYSGELGVPLLTVLFGGTQNQVQHGFPTSTVGIAPTMAAEVAFADTCLQRPEAPHTVDLWAVHLALCVVEAVQEGT